MITAMLPVAAALLLATGCGASRDSYFEGEMGKSAPMEASRSGSAVMDFAEEMAPASPSEAPQARKLVTTGSMELEADDLDKAESAVRTAVEEAAGYVQSSRRYTDSFSMTLKIPADVFSGFLGKAESFGSVRSKSVDVEDVTDSYFDLEHRIRGKEILVERYQYYLEEADSVEDLLTVERELNTAITELEQLEGSFRALGHQISYATLYLEVYLPSWESESDPLPSLRAGLKEFGRTAVRVLYAIFFIVLGIAVFGVPGVLAIGLVYWIGFGKIGLVRRFFRRLRSSGGGRKEDD